MQLPGHELYKKRERLFLKHTWGPFQAKRWMVFAALYAFFFGLPWLKIGDRPAVLLDIPARKFHIFWVTFWPQDLYMLSLFLMTLAISLFLVTAIWGRLWCGFACPQTVGTTLFYEIERLTEGDRNQQVRLQKSPWTLEKVVRRFAKHALFMLVSALFSYNLLSYFISMPELLHRTASMTLDQGNWFALAFFFFLAYADFGRFRENLCHGPCPYGRFQGVMLDPNSLVLTYDAKRGEPRGFFRKGEERQAGSCIDCKMCVEVCPAGIDIRKGPQFECLSCMRCADACDTVMEKVGFPKHLIRIESENEVNGKPTKIVRPRLFFYGALLTFLISSLTYLSLNHPVTKVDIVRTRSFISQVLPDGRVANVYIIKALNMDDVGHTYQVEYDGIQAEVLGGNREIQAKAGEVVQKSVALAVKPSDETPHVTRFHFKLREAATGKLLASHPSTFLMPEEDDDDDEKDQDEKKDKHEKDLKDRVD